MHLDVLPHLKRWIFCPGYEGYDSLYDPSFGATVSAGVLTSFHLPDSLSLEKRAQFTQALSTAMPALESCSADDETVIQEIETLVGQSVGIVSRGPSAENVQTLDSLPF
jgi:hypothetical protein